MYLNGIVYRGSPSQPCKSLSLFIPMSLTYLLNIAKDNDFVNKLVYNPTRCGEFFNIMCRVIFLNN
jgi:hypothetical protein